ncbi:dihydrofolate reductase family protein [Virgisporangium aliadipatigenens]|uniref:dihydrofolate reductase family protein n=1 Tax=Virgisporangium aliadipatigenens TaxID=741659 RepID=UPI001943A31F|nr:dihydrofolate reductase family protein [Virgisporangium aliadipatigenens]
MTRTQYYTATTVDGYIATEDNSLRWLFEVEGADGEASEGFGPFFSQVGAFAMGATTYEWVREHESAVMWRDAYGDTPCWVFTTRDLPSIEGANLHFVRGDVRPVHRTMAEAAGGRNIWLVGGGELVGAFADAGLLDELILSVAPVTLGAGAPLLPRVLTSKRLRLTSVRQSGQFASLTYEVGPPAE